MIEITKEYNFTEHSIFLNSEINASIKNINYACEIIGLEKIKSINEYYQNIRQVLDAKNIKKCLSYKNKNTYLNYLKNELLKKRYYTEYFIKTLPVKNDFLDRMIPLYYEGKVTEKPSYKNSIKTGRQSIESGFNFLTLKKELRKKLTTVKNHTLFEIDFVSCEPNFYFNSILNENLGKKNIYEYIAKKFNLNVDIKKFKNGLIAMLYGAADNTITKISGVKKDKIKEIKQYMQVEKFKKSIETEFKNNSMFLNFYKRPILDISNPVNYWIQSSVADYCCLAFNQFLNENSYLRIHAFIHDAIIVSCPNQHIQNLLSIGMIHENVSNIVMPVRIKEVS